MKAALGESLLTKKAPSGVPVVSPFADWDYYYLRAPISWKPEPPNEQSFISVTVPRGFVTDFASIPRPFWSLLPPTSKYTHSAIIHDYLYWTQDGSRLIADQIFRMGMTELRVPKWQVFVIFQSVNWLGGRAWNSNAQLKLQGEKRFLRKFPTSPATTWMQWKVQAGVFM